MKPETIHHLVNEKNQESERHVLSTATEIIKQIARKQHNIAQEEKDIVELRKQLKQLEVPQIKASDILGE